MESLYYLKNFRFVMDSLADRYGDLLSTEETRFIEGFAALPQASAALLVRMVMRTRVDFRCSQLRYAEIGSVHDAAEPLAAAGWVDAQPLLDLQELQRLLTKREVIRYLKPPISPDRRRKAELIDALSPASVHPRDFSGWCPQSDERVYRLKIASLCERLRLLFFGNFRQTWCEFVLAELGVFAYEKIECPRHSRPFARREHFEHFLQLYRCTQWLHEGAPLADVRQLLPGSIDSDWLEDRRHKLLFGLARAFERAQDTKSALQLYEQCDFPGARVRRIRLYERSQDFGTARTLIAEAQQAPRDAAEQQQLQRAARRLNRRLGVRVERSASRGSALPQFDLTLERPAGPCAIERYVGDFLARQDDGAAAVHYVENGLVNSLFGLLCWPAVFAPVSGAFFHEFHRGPADLSSARFYERRRHEFEQCFALLDEDAHGPAIRHFYRVKNGVQSPFVAWGLLSDALMEGALACFPAAHLKLWFQWIARDVRVNCTGFPDLVQFWPDEGRYRMIEVKGPGDRLQDNQRRLLEFCAAHRMPVSVCRIKWAH